MPVLNEPEPISSHAWRQILRVATNAAREAGSLVIGASKGSRIIHTKSSPTDFVTQVDLASERLIYDIITGDRPDDGIIGEEGSFKESRSGVEWIIDPIDGTVNYLRGLPNYSISVAATYDGESIVGVVYDPSLDEMFTSVRGRGAMLNGRKISCAHAVFSESIIATGFSYSSTDRARQAETLQRLLPAIADIRRPGSAAISLCWVACGRVDAFFEVGLKPWDYAAGALIASEAGAEVSGADLQKRQDRLVLAATPSVISDLRSLLLSDD